VQQAGDPGAQRRGQLAQPFSLAQLDYMHLQHRTQVYPRPLLVAQRKAPARLVGVLVKQVTGQQTDADGWLELLIVLARLQLAGQGACHAVDIALGPMQIAPQLHFHAQPLPLGVFGQDVQHDAFAGQLGRQDMRIQDAPHRDRRCGIQHRVDQVRQQGKVGGEQDLEDQVVAKRQSALGSLGVAACGGGRARGLHVCQS